MLSTLTRCRGRNVAGARVGARGTMPPSSSKDLALVAHENGLTDGLGGYLSQTAGSGFIGKKPRTSAHQLWNHHDAVLVDQIAFGKGVHDAAAADDDKIARCLLLGNGFEKIA